MTCETDKNEKKNKLRVCVKAETKGSAPPASDDKKSRRKSETRSAPETDSSPPTPEGDKDVTDSAPLPVQ